jgi:predicted phage terminase large subunit-like protein
VQLDASLVEGFVEACLAKSFDNRSPIQEFHREWWDLCCSDARYVSIAAPRSHAKSTAITHAFTLASVLFRDRDYVVLVSDTEGQAVQFLNDIKQELAENEDIINFFKIKKFIKDSETDIIVLCEDGHRFRIQCRGSEQKVRGLKWKNKRPNLIICDDLENDEIVMNQDRREKFRKWFYGALIPCLSDYGKIRMVGTILHLDSLLERTMPKDLSKTTVQEKLKAYSTDTKSMWKSVRYRAHNEDYGAVLWMDRFSKQRLQQIRQGYIDDGHPDVYNQEYLNYPIDETRAYFKTADFIPMTVTDKQDLENGNLLLNYYVGADLAISEAERADYTCFVVAGIDSNGKMYVVEVIKDRLDGREIIDLIMEIQVKYRPMFFAIEREKITKAIGPFLREEMLRRGIFPIVEEMQPSADKQTRARSIQGRMRTANVKFDKASDWYAPFEMELRQFPKARNDDQVDAFAYIGLALDKFVQANTPQEQEQEDYDYDVWHNQQLDGESGRSNTTGY